MRKTLLTILLMPAIMLVCCNVSIARGDDRSPPGIESKMSIVEFQDCQAQPCELFDCQLQALEVAEVSVPVIPVKDIWLSTQAVEQPPDMIFNQASMDRSQLANQPLRWGECYHPLRE